MNPSRTTDQESSGGKHIRHKLSSSAFVIRLVVSSKYIALSLDDKSIHVFTAAGRLLVVFRDGMDNAWSLALQDDVLLAGELGGDIQCYDLNTWYVTNSLMWANTDDGGTIAHQSISRSIQRWQGHTQTVRCIKFIDETTAVSASRDSYLRIWNVRTGNCEGVLSGHSDTVYDLAVTHDRVISGSKDGTARVWRVSEQTEAAILSGHSQAVWTVATDGKIVVTGSLDTDVRVWDLATARLLAVLGGHAAMINRTIISHQLLFTSSANGDIIIWSLEGYTAHHTIPNAHDGAVFCLDVCEGKLLSGGSDGAVKLWHAETAEYLGDIMAKTPVIWSVSFAHAEDSNCIVVASGQSDSPPAKQHEVFLEVGYSME